MEDIRIIIGENLANLRKEKGLTQLELADTFNYSDKAISKWEKGDTLPDIETLYKLCEFYGVTLDYLTHVGNRNEKSEFVKEDLGKKFRNNIISTSMLLSIIVMIMTIVYVYVLITDGRNLWTLGIWTVPALAVTLAFANRIYFHKRIIYFISFRFYTIIYFFFFAFF